MSRGKREMRDAIVMLCCLLSGLTLGVLLVKIKSFGSYTARIERVSELTRQSNELTRQSNMRTIDEIRANSAENEITQAKTQAVFEALRDILHDKRSA